MYKEIISNGIESALKGEAEAYLSDEMASAISEAAIYDCVGNRELLALDRTSKQLVQYDIRKAIFAAAGALGATIPLVVSSIGIVSILAGIGALGALQGLKQPLPKSCAIIIHCLLSNKMMNYEDLKSEFFTNCEAPRNLAVIDFKLALERLVQIGSVSRKGENVCLVERVLVRK